MNCRVLLLRLGILGGVILTSHFSILFSQTPISFQISNSEGKGLAFVGLHLEELKLNLTTDLEGYASFQFDRNLINGHNNDSLSISELNELTVNTTHIFYKSERLKFELDSILFNSKKVFDFHITLISKVTNIDNAIVTGCTSPTHLDSAVRSIRVLDRSIIEGRSATNARDLLRNELNIKISEDAILGSRISMLGLGGQNVKILIDGVPMIGRLNGNIDLSQIDLSNIERVEIIEGPMSVEFGTNALAGTINFISKNTITSQTEGLVGAKYESTGQYTQRANLNFKNDLANLSIHANRLYFDGWSGTDREIDWIEDFVADSGRVSSWNPKLQHSATIKLKVLVGEMTITPSFSYFDETITNRGYPRAPYGEFAFDEYYVTQRLNPSLTINKFNETEKIFNGVFSWSQFNRFKNRFSTDLTNLNSIIVNNPGANDTTNVNQIMTRGSRLFQFNNPWSLRFGWDVNRETLSGLRITDYIKEITDAAAFMQLGYKKKSNTIQFGLRKAWNSAYPPPITPSLHYLHAKGLYQLRLSYAKGFRSPSIKELYFEFIDTNHNLIGNPELEAETSNNIQFSLKRKIHEGSFQIKSHLSYVENMIQLVQISDDLIYEYNNSENVLSHGVKLSYSGAYKNLSYELGSALLGITYDETVYSAEYAFDLRWDFNSSRSQLHLSTKRNGLVSRFYKDVDGEILRGETDPFTFINCNLMHRSSKGNIKTSIGVQNILDVQNVNTTGVSEGHSESTGAYMMSWGRSLTLSTVITFNH